MSTGASGQSYIWPAVALGAAKIGAPQIEDVLALTNLEDRICGEKDASFLLLAESLASEVVSARQFFPSAFSGPLMLMTLASQSDLPNVPSTELACSWIFLTSRPRPESWEIHTGRSMSVMVPLALITGVRPLPTARLFFLTRSDILSPALTFLDIVLLQSLETSPINQWAMNMTHVRWRLNTTSREVNNWVQGWTMSLRTTYLPVRFLKMILTIAAYLLFSHFWNSPLEDHGSDCKVVATQLSEEQHGKSNSRRGSWNLIPPKLAINHKTCHSNLFSPF